MVNYGSVIVLISSEKYRKDIFKISSVFFLILKRQNYKKQQLICKALLEKYIL